MERKIISIDIKPGTLNQETTENAGVMWEHNATEIHFNLDDVYIGEDYRYYIEYRSVMGTKDRTAYLTQFNKQIKFIIPVSMTSLKSVECYFNIATIDEDGNTIQIIKPVKFCLDFDFSGNIDNSVAKSNDFSINSLLEAIRNGNFKGEKGDKGDSYELTQEDLLEVSRNVSEEIYGLPFVREIKGKGSKEIKGVSAKGVSESFEIKGPVPSFEGIDEGELSLLDCVNNVDIFVGENKVEHLLKPEKYSEFYKDESAYDTSYFVAPIFLKPNTEYVLVRWLNVVNDIIAGIKPKEGECQFFASYADAYLQKKSVTFTTGESGVTYLVASDVGDDMDVYTEVLQGTFLGLAIFEVEQYCHCSATFETPLYTVSENCYDFADITLGKAVHNVAHFQVPITVTENGNAAFVYNGRIIYRYEVPIAEEPDCRLEYDVFSTHYTNTDVLIETNEDVGKFLEQNIGGTGIHLDRVNSKIYIYSNKNPTTYKVFLLTEEARGTSVAVYYQKRNVVEESIDKQDVVIKNDYKKISVYPANVEWKTKVNGCVSTALNEILDKIETL